MKVLVSNLVCFLLLLTEPSWAAGTCQKPFAQRSQGDESVVYEVQAATEVIDLLTQYLHSNQYSHPTVLIRSISPDRLGQLLSSGTDRDDSSETYDIPIADASAAMREQHGVTPGQVSFMHEVTTDRWETVSLHFSSVSFAEKLKQYDPDPFNCYAIAIYDPRGLKRVSEVEYWFLGNPKESLLAVFVKQCSFH